MNQRKDNFNINELRKKEHLKCFLFSKSDNDNGFEDVILQNNSLPEINFDEISLETEFLGKKIDAPLMINAITGGTDNTIEINKDLAMLAKKHNIPIAVGSQSLGLKNPDACESYKIVRDTNDNGVVISNLGASKNSEEINSAIKMIDADAIQLHLNIPQEICMKEGDRDFKGIFENIKEAVENTDKPIIAKEVGFGVSKNTAQRLKSVGVQYIDIGGKGGTNFIEIEDMRNNERDFKEFYSWGIPTASSLLQCSKVDKDLKIICSGGIKKAEEIVKALCLGAKMVGISGIILKELMTKGYEAADKLLDNLIYKTKIYMLFLGVDKVEDLSKVDYILKNDLKLIDEKYS